MIKTKINTLETEEWQTFINITNDVKDFVKQTGINNGTVSVYTKHTTTGIKINEHESLLIKDLEMFLERMAPRTVTYLHDDLSKREVPQHERINGHSHLKSFVTNTSETIPIIDGELQLGRWQNIFFMEYDSGRTRQYIIQVIGDA